MADQMAKDKQFDYPSNLVIQKEPHAPRIDDPTGEPESLYGRIDPKQMGIFAAREKPKKPEKITDPAKKKKKESDAIFNPKKKTKIQISSGVSALNVEIEDNLLYKPKTKENRLIYEQILSRIHQSLGDEPQEVLKSVTDEVLAELKIDNKKDQEKKVEIEAMLACKLNPEIFSELLNLSKQITDYVGDPEENIDRLEEEMRVAFVLDEENLKEDEEEGDEDEDNKIKDYESDEEGEKEGVDDQEGKIIMAMHNEDEGEPEEINAKYNLEVSQIDAYWLQTELNKNFNDPLIAQKLEIEIMKVLNVTHDIECENKLVMLLSHEKFDLIKLFLKNRFKLYFCTRLGRAQNPAEKEKIMEEMKQSVIGEEILENLEKIKLRKDKDRENIINVKKEAKYLSKLSKDHPPSENLLETMQITDEDFSKINIKYIDLESLTFTNGNHFMSNEKCQLPPGSWRLAKKGYDEIYVPAVKTKRDDIPIIQINSLPDWAQAPFAQLKTLNVIQSHVYQTALFTPENMLICAPTGAGKTNIALLAMLQVIGNYRKRDGSIDRNKFKIIYIAPMKALVAEMVGNFTKRLESFNLTIRELTGDMQLTKQQIEETQIIVATPEKWDIVTRKSGDRTFTELVKLIIIDEIHLLHDMRGPVLEALVARTIRMIEQTQEMVRIVGLSATLPNYADVASFIRVKANKGLFYFDNSFRPVPLEQQYIGITEKKAIKKMLLMNEILYEKVMERAGKYQILIFVHSRNETVKTAKALKEMAFSKDELSKILKEDSASAQILKAETENVKYNDLKELLPFGFAVHHAGLHRLDRNLVEDLFADKHIQVLVSTSTLAWGVNLPAHTVIIKGTQIYSPEQGKWIELSPQDILQMLGRGGRPTYDVKGEGIIITSYQELKYYLSLLNQQLPIESQFLTQLADQMNAEIVLGSIMNTKDAVNWLGYTYLYVRMMRSPQVYGISDDELAQDPLLIKRRADLVHSAATLLDKHNLIKYEKKTGSFQVSYLGKIASHYYIKYPSIAVYNENIKPSMSIIDLFKTFSLSSEFKYIPIREEEKLELQKIMEKVPLPIKGSHEDPSTKINVLLQSYISRIKLDGFALNADMIYVTQSAGRIMRGLFEIFMRRGWAQIAEIGLTACKMIDKRMWSCMTPLRQFKGIPEEILRRIEKKEQMTWEHFYNMTPQQIGDLIKFNKLGKVLHKFIHQFPRIELTAYVQPITRSCLKIDLTVTPDFHWDDKIHGRCEPFWIVVEDCDNEMALYIEQFVLKQKYVGEKEFNFEFTVPLFEPLHPLYYIKVISDRWLQCDAQLPVSFKNLILPEKFPVPTELLDLQLLPIKALKWTEAEILFERLGISNLNSIQTQVFSAFYHSDETIFLGAPTGSGKTICTILAILRSIKNDQNGKIVYIGPLENICKTKFKYFNDLFSQFHKKVVLMTGQVTIDLKSIEKSDIIISSPENWDVVSRRWKQRKVIQAVSVFIVDELHLMSHTNSVLEVITSRMRYMATQLEKQIRIVGLATSVANYKSISEWIGANPNFAFNFHPNVRPVPLEIYIHGFDQSNKKSRIYSMEKYVYQGIKQQSKGKQVIIFVSDRKQARITALNLLTMTYSDNKSKQFLSISEPEIQQFASNIKERNLKHVITYGISFVYEGMNEDEKALVLQLFEAEAIQILICTYQLCWEIETSAYMVIIMDTQRYDGKEKRYIDYTVPDMLQMMGRATQAKNKESSKCLVFCYTPKKDFYKKFLYEPYPVESNLNQYLIDHLNVEIVSKTIENKQDCVDWITWTFMYRRLTQNPNFYNLQEISGSHINNYLSELIENTVEELESSKCIAVEDEMELVPLNLGIIASYYSINFATLDNFSKSLNQNSKLKQIIEILANSTEFENIPIRHGEDPVLKALVPELTYKLEKAKFNDPNTKTNILLQCHFSRTTLTPDFYFDQKLILEKSISLIQAVVDVISSNCWLKPAILSMQLCQMIIQAQWITDSPLKQLPHLSKEIIDNLKKKGVEDIADFLNMEDELRKEILKLSEDQMADVAKACNRYPSIIIEKGIKNEEDIKAGENVSIDVVISREGEEGDFKDFVYAPFYPKEKEEYWWVLIGDMKSNKLYAIKRINFGVKIKVELKFIAPTPGEYELTLYCICDSYVGCDQGEKIKLVVGENPIAVEVKENGK